MFTYVDAASSTCLDPDGHQSALERAAADHFAKGRYFEAFVCADRRCRIAPRPDERVFLLLGETMRGIDVRHAASATFRTAFRRATWDCVVVQRLLQSGDPELVDRAARVLVAMPRAGRQALRHALLALERSGVSFAGRLDADDDAVRGWCAWHGGSASLHVDLRRDGGSPSNQTLSLAGSPWHALARDPWRARNVSINAAARVAAVRPLMEGTSVPNTAVLAFRARLTGDERRGWRDAAPHRPPSRPAQCSVIVPVYGDASLTARCLSRLVDQTMDVVLRIIVVDDNPDDPEIARMLARFEGLPSVTILRNATNLGFVGSVNRALDLACHDDVVLLNSDALLPAGALHRLQIAAYSAASIGTVTPLSNNGELTSHPVPFQINALVSDAEIDALDAAAQDRNAATRIAIPNGIGFCLFIKNDCLRQTGNLRHCFREGYFEDVDFCLRAREQGFVNICAADVYVGHYGSRSFKDRKQALIARNAGIIAQRFPRYKLESRAHAAIDPLKMARLRLAKGIPSLKPAAVWIVGYHRDIALMEWRGRQLLREGADVRLLLLSFSRSDHVEMGMLLDDESQVATARFACGEIEAALRDRVDSDPAFRVEAAGMQALDHALLRECGNAVSLSLVLDGHVSQAALAALRSVPALVAVNAMAVAFCHRHGLAVVRGAQFPPLSPSRRWRAGGRSLGLLYPRADIRSEQLLLRLCRAFAVRLPDLQIVIMGEGVDPIRLMGAGTVIVLGPVDPRQDGSVIAQYDVGAVVGCERRGGFGRLEAIGRAAACPVGFFDWSEGAFKAAACDLALDPDADDGGIIDQIASWCGRHLVAPDVYVP